MTDKKEEKDEEVDMVFEPLSLTRQLVFRNDAIAGIGQQPDRIWFIIDSIKRLISDPNVGDEVLRNHYGDDFKEMMQTLEKIHVMATVVKEFYDITRAKNLLEWDLESPQFLKFAKYNAMLPLYTLKIYEMYYLLIDNTTLRDQSIPSEAFAEANRKYKRFEIEEEEARQVEKKDKEELEDEE